MMSQLKIGTIIFCVKFFHFSSSLSLAHLHQCNRIIMLFTHRCSVVDRKSFSRLSSIRNFPCFSADYVFKNSPFRYFFIASFSFAGVSSVFTGSHTPLPFIPPSSAFVMRTSVSFGHVLGEFVSSSYP